MDSVVDKSLAGISIGLVLSVVLVVVGACAIVIFVVFGLYFCVLSPGVAIVRASILGVFGVVSLGFLLCLAGIIAVALQGISDLWFLAVVVDSDFFASSARVCRLSS